LLGLLLWNEYVATPLVPAVGLVDSGAEETLLPFEIARRLRLDDQLHEDAHGAEGVGARFPTWHTHVAVRGRLLRPRIRDFDTPWGPELRLRPVFAEISVALLGRSDFFPHFRITFETDRIGPIFHLDA
jgi:hypothetical protein